MSAVKHDVTVRGVRPVAAMAQILREDPDLAAGLDDVQLHAATPHAVAPVFRNHCGAWRFTPPPDHASLGALVLEGLIVVRLQVGRRAATELLGQGDVISPWVGAGSELTVPSVTTSWVLSDVRIALLDRAFALRTARWPEIHAAVTHRVILRARRLNLQAAINAIPRITERLDLTLWLLADRFGRMTPQGVCLPIRLTHAHLAEIVGAQRPSVTNAIRQLEEAGRLKRPTAFEWILAGHPPPRLIPLANTADCGA